MCLDEPAPAPLSAILAAVSTPLTRQSSVQCIFTETGAQLEFNSANLKTDPISGGATQVDVSSLEVVCSVDRTFFPVAQKWTSHHLLWMKDHAQWQSCSVLHCKKSWLVVKVKEGVFFRHFDIKVTQSYMRLSKAIPTR